MSKTSKNKRRKLALAAAAEADAHHDLLVNQLNDESEFDDPVKETGDDDDTDFSDISLKSNVG